MVAYAVIVGEVKIHDDSGEALRTYYKVLNKCGKKRLNAPEHSLQSPPREFMVSARLQQGILLAPVVSNFNKRRG